MDGAIVRRPGETCDRARVTSPLRVFAPAALVFSASCMHHEPVKPAAPPEPGKATVPKPSAATAGLEYVGGTAIQAKDSKTLSAWYNDRFGLPIKGDMPGGFYGGLGLEWGAVHNPHLRAWGGEPPGAAWTTDFRLYRCGLQAVPPPPP